MQLSSTVSKQDALYVAAIIVLFLFALLDGFATLVGTTREQRTVD